jgi:hypothetical protein
MTILTLPALRQNLNICLLSLILTGPLAASQPRIELSDPLRGVTFYSVQLSDGNINSHNVTSGKFDDSDRLTIGLSAMVMEDAKADQEYIFWVRHAGRRWLSYGEGSPVILLADGQRMPLEPLRAPQPSIGPDSQFLEKLEFRLPATALVKLGSSKRIRVELLANDGSVQVELGEESISSIAGFAERTGG